MAKSRTALLLLPVFGAAAEAAAQIRTAEEAVAAQREQVRGAGGEACDRSDRDAIVVCGRDDSARHRLPLPVVAAPGAAGRAGGEQMAALGAGEDPCSTVGPNQRCSGGLLVFGVAAKLVQGIRNLAERADE